MDQPPLQESKKRYESASGHSLPVLGVFQPKSVYVNGENKEMCAKNINFVVTELPQLNLLGRNVIVQLGVLIDNLWYFENVSFVSKRDSPVLQSMEADTSLQIAGKQMCQDFPDVFKQELGCLKDVELDVKFKLDAVPIFCKPRPVPFALQRFK